MVRSAEPVELQLLAQGCAVDAEGGGCTALIAAIPVQHLTQQRYLDFAEHQRVQTLGRLRIDINEIAADGARDAIAQRRLQKRFLRGICVQRCYGIHLVRPPEAIDLTGSRSETVPEFRLPGR